MHPIETKDQVYFGKGLAAQLKLVNTIIALTKPPLCDSLNTQYNSQTNYAVKQKKIQNSSFVSPVSSITKLVT